MRRLSAADAARVDGLEEIIDSLVELPRTSPTLSKLTNMNPSASYQSGRLS
jgi:hypothetical protein